MYKLGSNILEDSVGSYSIQHGDELVVTSNTRKSKKVFIYKHLSIQNISDFFINAGEIKLIGIISYDKKDYFNSSEYKNPSEGVTNNVPDAIFYTYGGSEKFQYSWEIDGTTESNGTTVQYAGSQFTYTTLTIGSQTGKYTLTVKDKQGQTLISQVSESFFVKPLEVNIGFQGRVNTSGSVNNFIGNMYSKDDNSFHLFHNRNSGFTSTQNITDSNVTHSNLTSANMKSKFKIKQELHEYIQLSSEQYSTSANGHIVVELIDAKTICNKLMYKSHIYNTVSEIYESQCKDICACSGGSNAFVNKKLALSPSGNIFVVYFKDSSSEHKLHVFEKSGDRFQEKVINSVLDKGIIVKDIQITDNEIAILTDNIEHGVCIINLEYDTKVYAKYTITDPSKVLIHERNQVFILNSTHIEILTKQITRLYLVSTFYDSDGLFKITFDKNSSPTAINEYSVNDFINYGNVDYIIRSITYFSGITQIKIDDGGTTIESNLDIVFYTSYTSSTTVIESLDNPCIQNNNYVFSMKSVDKTTIIMSQIMKTSDYLELNTYSNFNQTGVMRLVVGTKSLEYFALSEINNKKVLHIEAFYIKSQLHLGEKVNDTNNTVVGQLSHGNTFRNQVIIGSTSSGVKDDSVVLGNMETISILPNRGNTCSLGDLHHKFDATYTNRISFGNDVMTLPSSDGDENSILVRRGKNNLTWGTISSGYIDSLLDGYAKELEGNIQLPEPLDIIFYHTGSGKNNTGYGYEAMKMVTSGNNNTCIGNQAGKYLAGGNNNIIIGQEASTSTGNNGINQIVLGKSATGYGDNTTTIGNHSINGIVAGSTNCDLGKSDRRFNILNINIIEAEQFIICKGPITSYSDRRLKENIKEINAENALQLINNLEPVSFKHKNSQHNSLGFIAQDVDILQNDSNLKGITEKDNNDMFTLQYQSLIAPLIKVVQEQQKTINQLQERVTELEHKINV